MKQWMRLLGYTALIHLIYFAMFFSGAGFNSLKIGTENVLAFLNMGDTPANILTASAFDVARNRTEARMATDDIMRLEYGRALAAEEIPSPAMPQRLRERRFTSLPAGEILNISEIEAQIQQMTLRIDVEEILDDDNDHELSPRFGTGIE